MTELRLCHWGLSPRSQHMNDSKAAPATGAQVPRGVGILGQYEP